MLGAIEGQDACIKQTPEENEPTVDLHTVVEFAPNSQGTTSAMIATIVRLILP